MHGAQQKIREHVAKDDVSVCKTIKTKHEKIRDNIAGMRSAVTNGTCASFNTPTYQICGKTGTAENTGDDHSVFIGFAPMNNPKIAISVYIDNGGFGADLAAPLAAIILEKYLTGKLSDRSERHVKKWQSYAIEPPAQVDSTAIKAMKGKQITQKKRKEIPVTLDNL